MMSVRLRAASGLLIIAFMGVAPPRRAPAASCEGLATLARPNTTITSAQPIAAGSFTPPGGTNVIDELPPFCRVAGVIAPTQDSRILFEVWLPLQSWNGKFAGVGNGGLPRIENPEMLPEEPLITAITLAELTVGPLVATSDEERAARQAHLRQAESEYFEPLPFDANAARAFEQVAASPRRSGRKTAARSYDAMIAATAIANELPLYTCNPADFSDITGLEFVAVPVGREA